MTEILFYQLHQPLERALPLLLEKTMQRGWRAVVRVGSEPRLATLDETLWTYKDDGFLPHGTSSDGDGEMQPVYLTSQMDVPNAADVLFLVEGADSSETGAPSGFKRVVLLFDGNDEAQLLKAREDWKRTRASGLEATYWQQTEQGAWEKKA